MSDCERSPRPFFFFLNLLGNALILTPLGFSLYHLTNGSKLSNRRRIMLALLCGAVLSLSIEIVQLFYVGRYSDVDDVLLNSLGAVVGAWVASAQEQDRRLPSET